MITSNIRKIRPGMFNSAVETPETKMSQLFMKNDVSYMKYLNTSRGDRKHKVNVISY
jgi:hypothetical protein